MLAPVAARYQVPAPTRAALKAAVRSGLQMLKGEPPQRLVEWAREHFKLTADSSHQHGAWQPWAFQIGIMDALDDPAIEQVDVEKAKRVGYTKMVTAKVCHSVAHRRRKLGLWQPTDDDRDSYVKSEIEPAFAEMPVMRAARRATKGAEDTIKLKQFKASVAHFLGAKAARSFRRITLDDAILDEVDGMDQQVEKSADPVTLARGRLEGAATPKLILGSTPRLKNLSHVEREADNADAQLLFHVTCKHCGVDHPLIWAPDRRRGGFEWDGEDAKTSPTTVRHVCPHCLKPSSQADYLRAEPKGVWICTRTGLQYGPDRVWRDNRGQPTRPPRHVAYRRLWAAYSPQRTWSDIVREYLEAQAAARVGNKGPLQGFINETLAQTYEDDFEQTESDVLVRRAKAENLQLGVVPAEAGVVFLYVDVQADRWEYVAWAYGRDGESWAIEYQVIHGDTSDEAEWQAKVEPLIGKRYRHALGGHITVRAVGIDSGYQTHLAYAFARQHASRGVYATKGETQPGKAIKSRRKVMDINIRGKVVKRGVALWFIGTDTAKDLLHGRLQLEGRGPGRVHFAAGLPEAFFKQLTAEQRVPVRANGGLEYRWVLPAGRRNEVGDCTVGCLFLAEVTGVSGWTDRQWDKVLQAQAPDLFDTPEAPEPEKAPEPAHTSAPAELPPAPVISGGLISLAGMARFGGRP